MHRTIFDTPLVNTLLRAFSVAFLKLTGWKIEGSLPPGAEKSVLIAAPHTSNWDLPYTLMVSFALRLTPYWMGKEQIFKPPFRGQMMWLGGIPVRRESSNNLVAASVEAIKAATATWLRWSCRRLSPRVPIFSLEKAIFLASTSRTLRAE